MINSEEYLSTGLYYTQQAWWRVFEFTAAELLRAETEQVYA